MMPTSALAQKLLVRDSTSGVSERMVTLSAAVAHLLPVEICRRYHIVPIEFDRGLITMAGGGRDLLSDPRVRAAYLGE